jgi:hypothetical protein
VPVLVAGGSDPEAFTAAVLAAVGAGPAGGIRCRDVVEAMGQEAVARRVEQVRHHGKRLVWGVVSGRGLGQPRIAVVSRVNWRWPISL